jgi:hypothetical protein
MPAQDHVRSDQAMATQCAGQPPDEGREDCPVSPVHPWSRVGAAQDRDLVPQHRSSMSFMADVPPSSRTSPSTCRKIKYNKGSDTWGSCQVSIAAGQRPGRLLAPHRPVTAPQSPPCSNAAARRGSGPGDHAAAPTGCSRTRPRSYGQSSGARQGGDASTLVTGVASSSQTWMPSRTTFPCECWIHDPNRRVLAHCWHCCSKVGRAPPAAFSL